MESLRVSVVQMDSGSDPEENLEAVEGLLATASKPDLIALPEIFATRGSFDEMRAAAQPVPGPLTDRVASWAREHEAWILAGSILEKDGDRIFSTSLLLDPSGEAGAVYRKMHLFEKMDADETILETALYTAGDSPCTAAIGSWVAGLSVCYDLRFPELYRIYSEAGAHVLFAPSDFTQRTGQAHWHTLVRARAIENQCFVLAPNQCGRNVSTGVESYGHSLIVDPWGVMLAEAATTPSLIEAELDPGTLTAARDRLPSLRHRRL
jgi:predicted amidohydrolase